MLNLKFPHRYELLNGGSIFVSDIDKYKTDDLYQISLDLSSYEQFLNDLFNEVGKPAQKRFYLTVKNFLLNYTIVINKSFHEPVYQYSKNKIIIGLTDNKVYRIPAILGSVFFYVVGRMSYESRMIYIPVTSKIYTYLISKLSQRPITYEEITPRLFQYIVGWFLKKYNKLTPSNLSKYCIKAGKGFTSPSELKEVFETIRNLKRLDDFFDLIGNQISNSVVKQNFITRYSLDVALAFDDFAHGTIVLTIASYLNFFSPLNQYIMRSPLKKDLDKLSVSVSSRLITLPKF